MPRASRRPLTFTRFQDRLIELGACNRGFYRVGRKTIDQAWEECTNADDLRWLIWKISGGLGGSSAHCKTDPHDFELAGVRLPSLSVDHGTFCELYHNAPADLIRNVFRPVVVRYARRTRLPVRSRSKAWNPID